MSLPFAKKFVSILFLGILFFLNYTSLTKAAEVTCEYIPYDDHRNILYTQGSDADHRPWVRTMEEDACTALCSSLTMTCRGGPLGIGQNPEGCDATYLKCGKTESPTLTIPCKFEPKNVYESPLTDKKWERLTASEADCQRLCDDALRTCRECDVSKSSCGAVTSPPAPRGPEELITPPFSLTPPKLEIPLPALPQLTEFMSVEPQGEEVGNRYLFIPWLGQYIAALYKYAIGVTGILAGIMIVIAGLIWLTAGGSAEKISTAKSFIESALIGLVIALTSYLLLYAINPKLTEFEALKIKFIERVGMDAILNNTKVDTRESAEGAPPPSAEGAPPPSVSIPSFADCPITLTNPPPTEAQIAAGDPILQPERNPRTLEFIEKVRTIATGTTKGEKVLQIAQAAIKCAVTLGSCGKTLETINKLAGVQGRGREIYAINRDQLAYLDSIKCPAGSPRGCATEAKKKAYEKLKNELTHFPVIWPDTWAASLSPGDGFIIFNANRSTYGTHAAIFLGWQGSGRAKVIQGAWGKFVNEGTICLTSDCPNPAPLVRVFKAD